jgi:cellobiose phosphorylase
LYEAIDYTPSRLRKEEKANIVKSFMAHHQGMCLIALDNYFHGNAMQNRFHANPVIKSGELLLQEKIPSKVIFTNEHKLEFSLARKTEQEDGDVVRTYGVPDSELPHVHMLSNGSYSVMLTNGGSGYSRYYDTAVTRWREYSAGSSGMFIFIQNINSNTPWSATFEPYADQPQRYRTVFSPDKAEFFRKDGSIETHTEITVSPEDNAEIRKVSLTNRSQYIRVLELTSYFEVVLAHPDEDAAHPAFSNLFVRTEFVKKYNCLVASRRPRHEKQKTVWAVHTIAAENEVVGDVHYETDRMKFIGRNNSLRNPAAMNVDQPLTNTTGAVLDPIMSLRVRIKLEPGQTSSVAFIAGIADNRKNAIDMAEKYSDMKVLERAFELSWTRSQIEMRYFGFKSEEVEQYLNLMPAVIFSSPLRRLWTDKIQRNTKGQTGLWPYGISGDLPIVLVIVTSSDETDMVYWALKAHEFWRMKGLTADLVIVSMDEGGYTRPLQDLIKDAVSSSHARDMQEKPGGVFVRDGKVMNEEDINLLYTTARVVINESIDKTMDQLEDIRKAVDSVHSVVFPMAQANQDAAHLHMENFAADDLKFFNGIGGFSSDGREYVICLNEQRHTPAPWINVVSNPSFGFLISEAGSTYTWSDNSRENKLTPWSNDPVSDPSGEALYIRDEADGSFWSITPQPVREKGEYIVRHGHGYSTFFHASHGMEQQLTVFVPLHEPVKLNLVKFKNTTEIERTISVTYYVRPVLGVSDRYTAPYIATRLHKEKGLLLVTNTFSTDYPGRIAFVDVSERDRSFTGDRWEFIGTNGSMEEPQAMKANVLSETLGAGLDPCAAMQVKLHLAPGEEKEIVFLLGEGKDMDEVLRLSGSYSNADEARNELERVRSYWQSRLGTIEVNTPDPSMDILLNGWLLYQVIACRLWARSAFYQSGGAYGFRDQLQDVMAAAYTWPEITRKQILLHASHQFTEGDVQHWWHPGIGKGIRTKYSDDLLWLVYVTADYIQATGDMDILDEDAGYLEGKPLGEDENERYDIPRYSEERTSLYEHCIRTIEKALKFGQHGIPLMGSGDWNDGMNNVGNKGKGESVWLGWFLYTVLMRFIPLCKARKDEERAERYSNLAGKIHEAIEANAWDGSWYKRAYFDNGVPLGSAQNTECRIDSISQSWSVISGAGKHARSVEAMTAVENYLIDRNEGIIKLLTPPFDEGDLKPGYIKGYVPGVRENGGQYTHAAVWVILAFALLGKGDKAWEMFHLINPINHSRTNIEYSRYKAEPYVMAADVYAVYPNAGRGGWTWYTGAAGWMYRAGIEYLLGLRKHGDILYIKPCIPKKWQGFKVSYRNGNTVYEIEVHNPHEIDTGVVQVTVDGRVCDDGGVHLADDGGRHSVEVTMG